METIGQRIRKARKSAGLSLDALAKACGVSKSTVAAWEINQNVLKDIIKIKNIAIATSMPLIYFLGPFGICSLGDIITPAPSYRTD